MIKIIELGCEFPTTLEKRVTLLDESLIKTASNDIQHFWNTFERKPDKGYLHVIAMSAGEYYGCNNNGDYFYEKDLKKYHPSFVQDGNIFLFHQNKDPRLSLGKPIYSFYNDNMKRVELVLEFNKKDSKAKILIDKIKANEDVYLSMGCRVDHDICSICKHPSKTRSEYCFIPGTLITTYDGCLKKIEEVREGDLLLDAEGNITEVISLMNREIRESIVRFKTTINGFETLCTKNHPILASLFEDCGVCVTLNQYYITQGTPPCLPNSRKKCILCDKTNIHKDFICAGDLKEKDVVYSPIPAVNNFTNDDLTSEDAWIIGLFAAEGSFIKRYLTSGQKIYAGIQFALNGETEQVFIQRIVEYFKHKYNKYVGVNYSNTNKGVNVVVTDRGIAELFFSYVGEYAAYKRFAPNIFLAQNNILENLLAGVWDGDGHTPFNSKCRLRSSLNSISLNLINQTNLILYYLGYSGYSAVITHRSPRIDPDKYNMQYVLTSDYRQELLIEKNNNHRTLRGRTDTHIVGYIKTIDEIDYVGSVYNLETTSGTYIANGIAVHNCDHLKYNLKKILPDGRQSVAINPGPLKFFDISIVNRPADRTAWALQKEASDGTQIEEPVISSAELGEQYEDTQNKLASLKKLSDIIKFVDGDIVDADNVDLSKLEVLRALKKQNVRSLDYPTMDSDDLDNLKASPGAIIRVFINQGAPLSLGEVAHISGRHVMGDDFKSSMIPSILSMLPKAIDSLQDNPDDIDDLVSSILNNYKGELDSPESESKLIEQTKPVVSKRIIIIKQACDESELKKLAQVIPVPTHATLPHLDQHRRRDAISLAKDILLKYTDEGTPMLQTHEVIDQNGEHYLTNSGNILTARAIEDSRVAIPQLLGASITAAGLATIFTNASLLNKIIAALGATALGASIASYGQQKTRIQTTQQLEIPNSTVFSRAIAPMQKIGGMDTLWNAVKDNKATAVGMAVPAIFGLDYLYTKHFKYPTNPNPEENMSTVSKAIHKAGKTVVENPVSTVALSGIGATVLGEMLKRKK